MHQTFQELGFKPGDKIRCTESEVDTYKPGDIFTLEDHHGDPIIKVGNKVRCGFCGSWEHFEPWWKRLLNWATRNEDLA